MSIKPKFLVLMIVIVVFGVTNSQQEEEVVFQELNPDVIREILEDLLKQGATLQLHREQQHRTKSKLLLQESIYFETEDGDLFIVYSETIFGKLQSVKILNVKVLKVYFLQTSTKSRIGHSLTLPMCKPQSCYFH